MEKMALAVSVLCQVECGIQQAPCMLKEEKCIVVITGLPTEMMQLCPASVNPTDMLL